MSHGLGLEMNRFDVQQGIFDQNDVTYCIESPANILVPETRGLRREKKPS